MSYGPTRMTYAQQEMMEQPLKNGMCDFLYLFHNAIIFMIKYNLGKIYI